MAAFSAAQNNVSTPGLLSSALIETLDDALGGLRNRNHRALPITADLAVTPANDVLMPAISFRAGRYRSAPNRYQLEITLQVCATPGH